MGSRYCSFPLKATAATRTTTAVTKVVTAVSSAMLPITTETGSGIKAGTVSPRIAG